MEGFTRVRVAAAFLAAVCALSGCGKTSSDPGNEIAESCDPLAGVSSGAAAGPLAIEGHLADPSGQPIVGARVDLKGAVTAVRFSDFTGGYHFYVWPGAYQLEVSGDCEFTSSSRALGAIDGNRIEDFVATGDGCAVSSIREYGSNAIQIDVARNGLAFGQTQEWVREGSGRDEALDYLQIFIEQNANRLPVCELQIADQTALEARGVVSSLGIQGLGTNYWLELDTLIVVDSGVVSFSTTLAVEAPVETQDFFLAAARNFTLAELPELRLPP